MKVYELMNELQQLPAGAEVYVSGDESGSQWLDVMGADVDGLCDLESGVCIIGYGITHKGAAR